MKFLIIGLGSMGKRRVRNLQAIGDHEILGVDLSKEKRNECEEKYKIKTFEQVRDVELNNYDAIIISTPPDHHNEWLEFAIDNKKPVFVEASVILNGLNEIDLKAKEKNILVAPSCTLRFFTPIKMLKNIVESDKYGRFINFSYHLGQYLPDWHPWEKVGDSYTGKKETSGAREMVAFELTWLTDIVGMPESFKGFYGKTMDFGVEIDDTYAISFKFRNAFGNMLIDTTARFGTRTLILNLEKAQILWRWDIKNIRIYEADSKSWQEITFETGKAEKGYNENITEDMYIDEMKSFISAIKGEKDFPNTLMEDIKILEILNNFEKQNNN